MTSSCHFLGAVGRRYTYCAVLLLSVVCESSVGDLDIPVASIQAATKRTYQPSTRRRKRKHGFLARYVMCRTSWMQTPLSMINAYATCSLFGDLSTYRAAYRSLCGLCTTSLGALRSCRLLLDKLVVPVCAAWWFSVQAEDEGRTQGAHASQGQGPAAGWLLEGDAAMPWAVR